MDDFAILTTRKRALIALAHSIVFLGFALHGFASPRQALSHGPGLALGGMLLLIYLIVGSILGWLTRIAQSTKEQAYFAFCTCSATFGSLRTLFGDTSLPLAQYLRVAMLVCAVFTGLWILRSFSQADVTDWNPLPQVTPTPQQEAAQE
jgi:hypothetical protein